MDGLAKEERHASLQPKEDKRCDYDLSPSQPACLHVDNTEESVDNGEDARSQEDDVKVSDAPLNKILKGSSHYIHAICGVAAGSRGSGHGK
jgi:hypothetical protein